MKFTLFFLIMKNIFLKFIVISVNINLLNFFKIVKNILLKKTINIYVNYKIYSIFFKFIINLFRKNIVIYVKMKFTIFFQKS